MTIHLAPLTLATFTLSYPTLVCFPGAIANSPKDHSAFNHTLAQLLRSIQEFMGASSHVTDSYKIIGDWNAYASVKFEPLFKVQECMDVALVL